jgi:preprotein translocase subunit SecD
MDGRWRTYFLEKATSLEGDVVAGASLASDEERGPLVAVELTPEATSRLGELTTRHLGRKMAILVDGAVMTVPVIMSTVSGPRVTIDAAGAGEAEALVARLREKR